MVTLREDLPISAPVVPWRRILLGLLQCTLLAIVLPLLCFVLTALSLVTLQKGWRVYNARPMQFLLAGSIAAYLIVRLRPSPQSRAWLKATRPGRVCLAAGIVAAVTLPLWAWTTMVAMPGWSFSGPLDPLAPEEARLRDDLRRDVVELSGTIGVRDLPRYANLMRAAEFLEGSLRAAGYEVRRQTYTAFGRDFHNLEAEQQGSGNADGIVIVGGHYDTAEAAPGADDNATGAAAVLALARAFVGHPAARTVRFVEFVNEEPPHFQGPTMGSLVYARQCARRDERVTAMLSLETLGYYADEMGTQAMPFPLSLFYPSSGDFVAVAGDTRSAPLVREVVGSFRRNARFPCHGAAVPAFIPGVDWSDHWSFWQAGYPAVLVTDTAPFRNPHYHKESDTADRLDFARLARVVRGLEAVVRELASRPEPR